jgi:hypothetical protein
MTPEPLVEERGARNLPLFPVEVRIKRCRNLEIPLAGHGMGTIFGHTL